MRNRADHLHLSRQIALLGVIITCAVMIVMLPLYGSLSDRFGRRRLFGWGAAGIGLLAFPSFWLMDTQATPLVWLAIIIPFGLVYPTVYGPRAELFSELFDTRVRYSGISFVYQFSGIFASGLTPIVATALLAAGGNRPWLICTYVLAVSLVSVISVYAMKETVKRDISIDEARGAPTDVPG